MIAIDLSEDGASIVALVGVEDHVLKSRKFQRLVSWAKHYREIGSNKKRRYLERFPQRYAKILSYIEVSRIYFSYADLDKDLRRIGKPVAVILIDDKLVNKVTTPSRAIVIAESRIKYRHHRQLMALADNLANYFRVLLGSKPSQLRKELEKLTK